MAEQPIPRAADGRVDTAAYAKSQGRVPAKSPLGGINDKPLSERPAQKVGKGKRVGGVKKRNRAAPFDMGAYLMSQQGMQQQGMQAILDAYTKSQQKQPMIRRNLDGSIADQTKQPEGLDWFKKNNPYTDEAQQRKRNVNAENAYQRQMGMFEGYNAVQAKKAEQAAMGNQDPNTVMSKTVNGQKFVFDKQGNPVGMTGDNRVNPEGGNRLTGSGAELTRNAFVDAMSKSDAKPAVMPQQIAATAIPTAAASTPNSMLAFNSQLPAPVVAPLPKLPPGVPGQLYNFNPDGSIMNEEQAFMANQTLSPKQMAGSAIMQSLFGNPEKFKKPTNFSFPPF